MISSSYFPENPTCNMGKGYKDEQARVWLSRVSRPSGNYNLNNGKQLTVRDTQSAVKPTWRGVTLRGVCHSRFSQILDQLLTCYDFPQIPPSRLHAWAGTEQRGSEAVWFASLGGPDLAWGVALRRI